MGAPVLILRPDAVVLPGAVIAPGLEVCISEGRIDAIRPWTTAAREETGLLLSPAFVNAHSHLEYYDFLGKLDGLAYWEWIREITKQKPKRPLNQVQAAANTAARLNVATGVAAIGEYSDWPVSGAAIRRAGLAGRIFQEVITVNEWHTPTQKLAEVAEKAGMQAQESGLPTHMSAHATYTVEADTIRGIAVKKDFNAIHASETELENEFFLHGTGAIADMYRQSDISFTPPGCTAVRYLHDLGALHSNTQLIHCCALNDDDIDTIANSGSTVAHCPRSNEMLRCPPAPIARLRNAGVSVGLGMDSAASSGPIDFFAEMRAAIAVSHKRGEPLTAEDVWMMATTEGAKSIWMEADWRIAEGAAPSLVLLKPRASWLEEIIRDGNPANVVKMVNLDLLHSGAES